MQNLSPCHPWPCCKPMPTNTARRWPPRKPVHGWLRNCSWPSAGSLFWGAVGSATATRRRWGTTTAPRKALIGGATATTVVTPLWCGRWMHGTAPICTAATAFCPAASAMRQAKCCLRPPGVLWAQGFKASTGISACRWVCTCSKPPSAMHPSRKMTKPPAPPGLGCPVTARLTKCAAGVCWCRCKARSTRVGRCRPAIPGPTTVMPAMP